METATAAATSSSGKSRVVIKIGTNSLIHEDRLAVGVIAELVETCTNLQELGFEVVVVTSGAVGVGCQAVGMKVRPKNLSQKQALAAVGQMRLMRMYDNLFSCVGRTCAQVLLSYENLSREESNRNAISTLNSLLSMDVVPIVNENDTVATQELKFGDNDKLSAMVAALIGAEWLILLTDVDGLYTANPKTNPNARRISTVKDLDEITLTVDTGDGAGSSFSTGGMTTKISAARLASAAGVKTVIMESSRPMRIINVLSPLNMSDSTSEHDIGTLILPQGSLIRKEKKRWIIGLTPKGTIFVNAGAAKALRNKKNLFSAGVTRIEGRFHEMNCVSIRLDSGDNVGRQEANVAATEAVHKASATEKRQSATVELARALVNYSSDELMQIQGLRSDEIREKLGLDTSIIDEVAHRNNIVLCNTKTHEL